MKNNVIFVIGVSGSGKSLIGQQLAREVRLPFIDADDHHANASIDKMSQGIPLTDDDRIPWLDELNRIVREESTEGCVIACSALKQSYRSRLMRSIESRTIWVYLHGTYEQIFARLAQRENHFMGANMLQSQFDALEIPEEALKIDISQSPEKIIAHIISKAIIKPD